MRTVDVLLAIPSLLLPQLTVIILLGFRHGKCGGGGWRHGCRQLRAPGASRSGARAPQRLRRGGPGQRRHFSPSSGAAACPTRSLRCALLTLQLDQAMLAGTSASLGYGTRAGPGVGTTDRRRSQLPVNRTVADHLPGLAVVAVVIPPIVNSRQWWYMTVLSVGNLRIATAPRGRMAPGCTTSAFSIQRGEMLAFVGESGSGKTTTAQCIIGLLADNATPDAGRIVLNGEVISDWSAKRLNRLRG